MVGVAAVHVGGDNQLFTVIDPFELDTTVTPTPAFMYEEPSANRVSDPVMFVTVNVRVASSYVKSESPVKIPPLLN
jgi:hypothetical protein